MWKVTITGAVPHPDGLRLALRVENEKAGWLRFAAAVLVVQSLDVPSRAALTKALDTYWSGVDEDLEQMRLFD